MDAWTTGLILPILVRQGALASALRDLIKAGSEIAPYTFIQNHDYLTLWEKIRSQDGVLSLLLSVTYEYVVRLGGVDSAAFKAVTKAFGSAVCFTTHPESFQDATVTERAVKAVDREKICDVFTNNIWFVVLVICGWINVKTLMHEAQEYGRVSSASA